MQIKKNVVNILAAIMILFGSSAFASEQFEVTISQIDSDTIRVSGKVSVPEAKVYMEIVRKDADIRDKNNIYMAKQVTADENGVFYVDCDMPEIDRANPEKNIDGYFSVHSFVAGYENEPVDFLYVIEKTEDKFFKELNDVKDSKSGLKTFFGNLEENKILFDKYSVYYEEFNTLSDRIIEKMVLILADEEDLIYTKDNINSLNELIITMRLNGIETIENAIEILEDEELKDRYNLEFGDIKYENFADEDKKDWFIKLFINKSKEYKFKNITDLNQLFCEAMILDEINSTHYSNLYGLLSNDAYSEYLKMEECAEFLKINGSQQKQEKVMNELKKLSNEIESVDDLHSLMSIAYKNYINNYNYNNSTGGSSGGSSGGSGNKGSATMVGALPNQGNVVASKPQDNKVSFEDLQGYEWAENSINKLAARGIVSGTGEGKFEPERNVTRAEFLKMLIGAMELVNESAECKFEDVPSDSWSYKYVASAYELGITGGKSDVMFGTNDLITRQEAATFLHRAANRAYIPLGNEHAERFNDFDTVSEWAQRSVEIIQNAGIINGMANNMFMPNECTTRAQAAKMICGLYDLL